MDPSIGAGGGYGGGYAQYGHHQPQAQPPLGDPYNPGYQAPAYTEAPSQPHFFTPDPGAAASPMAPPPASHHLPDQPGPGFTPAVSNGSGWNDPPPMMTKAVPEAVTNTTPAITQPLFGSAVQEQGPAQTNTWAGFQPAPVQAETSHPPPPHHHHPQAPAGFAGFQPAEPPPVNLPPAPAPTAAAPPAPIPAEHQVIQDTLENLRAKCQQVAAHPQVRRKLEDVSHKLDILYDKLRKQVLSPATLQGLHTILQHIWQYDYPACMQVISGLIAGGSFAEMSDFMPGVKVLLQVAQQQGVYVEYQS